MISNTEHNLFKRFNTVALTRIEKNVFLVPKDPPFWLLPFLEEGEQSGNRVNFNDPLAFVSNFLVDAEKKWQQKQLGGISSGVYSIQTGDSPELFYECRADRLYEEAVLLVELVGESSPGNRYESIRSARSQRLADNTQLSQNRKNEDASADTYVNGLPTLIARVEQTNQSLSFIRFNNSFQRLYFAETLPDDLFEHILGPEGANKLWSQAQQSKTKTLIENIPVKSVKNQPRLMQVELESLGDNPDTNLSVILRDVTGRVSAEHWLSTLSDRSVATGLFKRGTLDVFLLKSAKANTGLECGVGLIYIKMNGFRQINETYGKLAGNTLIASIAERLVATTDPIHSVFHLGSDEFAVLLEKVFDPDYLHQVERKIRQALKQTYQLAYSSHDVSFQIGQAMLTEETSIKELVPLAKSSATKS